MAQRLRTRAAAWAERRHGRDGAAATLTRRRIYLLPTRFGVGLATLVFAMLLGSLNYDTSLGFALTFLLTGVGLVAMRHCHANLQGLELRLSGARPVFAGQTALFHIAAHNDTPAARFELALAHGEGQGPPIDLAAGETQQLTLPVQASVRGWLALPRCSIVSRHPGKLFRAWSWLHLDGRCLVYPQPAPPGRPLPEQSPRTGGERADRAPGDADFLGLRTAHSNDPPNRIAWKAYARSDELLLKLFAGSADTASVMLDWNALPDLDVEARLSQLARWCVDLAAAGRRFGLALPEVRLDAGEGEAHLQRCLEALALFADPQPT